ncbi:MAG TPA: cyclic nucleotide-binding domain-containing protein, partial [Methylocystis sp.]|nr:cyclic nucleotide-binding domain-containing protein [Methylocystis sp.]
MSETSPISTRLRSRWLAEAKAQRHPRSPLFCALPEEEVALILQAGAILRAAPGETVVREGGTGDDLFLILSGAVAVRRRVNDEPRDLLTLREGQIFGELGFLAGFPRTADVAALLESEILVLSREAILRLAEAAPASAFTLVLNIAMALCQRLATSTDVHTDVLARSEKMKAQQEIDRRRTLSQMVAGVAHEINTPLGIANHAASIVAELAGDFAAAHREEGREALDDIVTACRLLQDNIARADRLVQTFKTLSVSQAVDSLEKVNLLQLTRDTAELYRLKARASKLVVTVVDRLGGESDEWEGYPGHYAQILLNLLTNIDRYAYAEETGGKVEIEIAPHGPADYGVIVRDFGRGIPEAELERVFEPFFT